MYVISAENLYDDLQDRLHELGELDFASLSHDEKRKVIDEEMAIHREAMRRQTLFSEALIEQEKTCYKGLIAKLIRSLRN